MWRTSLFWIRGPRRLTLRHQGLYAIPLRHSASSPPTGQCKKQLVNAAKRILTAQLKLDGLKIGFRRVVSGHNLELRSLLQAAGMSELAAARKVASTGRAELLPTRLMKGGHKIKCLQRADK